MSKKLRFLVSLALLGWLGWRSNWHQIGKTFAHLRPGLWLGAVALYALSQVVSGLRWQWLARPFGFRRSLGQFVGFYYVGMYFNLFLPTSVGGDVVRAFYLDGGSGRRLAAFVSVFLDRLSGLLVLLGLACCAVMFSPVAMPAWVRQSVWAAAGCAALGMAMLPFLGRWQVPVPKLALLGREIPRHMGRVLQPWSLFLSFLVQAANVMLVWMLGKAIGAPIPGSYYWVFVPMVTLLTLAPISLNGVGIREGGTVLFLAPLGVSEGMAVGLAFLWFSVFTAAGVCGGLVYLFGSFPRPEVNSDHDDLGNHSHQGRARQFKAAA